MKRSYIQDPETGKLVPREEYQRAGPISPYIQGDIEPFISPIDRSLITSRSKLAAHHRQHGTTDSRDYSREFIAKRAQERVKAQEQEGKRDRLNLIRRELERRGL